MMLPLDELTSECQPERHATSRVGRVGQHLLHSLLKRAIGCFPIAPEVVGMTTKKGGTAERKPFRPFGRNKVGHRGRKGFFHM
ncbi:hypothetical protein GGR98_000059 [Parageobacillus caldoxylosilyticus]|nr:hypothetical protein [Parageobacillus caldoxylosilyticus]